MAGQRGKSGGKRDGAGRKREFAPRNLFRKGDRLYAERQSLTGTDERRELWVVLSVGADEIEFQCGDEIIVVRKPDAALDEARA